MSMGRSPAGPLVDAAMADHVPGRLLLLAGVRSVGVVAATLLVYALVPIREETAPVVALVAIAGLVLLGVVFARQVARISRASRPVLAAIEALALVVGMFVTLFAFIYVSISADAPGAFTQAVDKMAGVYFSVTVLATVGFGDIAAVSHTARLLVTLQMVLDLVLIGVAVKVLSSSARRAVEAKLAAGSPGTQAPADPGNQPHG